MTNAASTNTALSLASTAGSMNEQEAHWAGPEGDAYLKRNQVDWAKRVPFWKEVIMVTGARSAFEVGCNAGWNLSAIKWAWPHVAVRGCDLNEASLLQASAAGLEVYHTQMRSGHRAELVFTAGVLIHVAPENLMALMATIVEASYRWVLAVEYAAETETEVEYRGMKERLWKRPYGKLYEQMGCSIKAHWSLRPEQGFDNCIATLLEKPQ